VANLWQNCATPSLANHKFQIPKVHENIWKFGRRSSLRSSEGTSGDRHDAQSADARSLPDLEGHGGCSEAGALFLCWARQNDGWGWHYRIQTAFLVTERATLLHSGEQIKQAISETKGGSSIPLWKLHPEVNYVPPHIAANPDRAGLD